MADLLVLYVDRLWLQFQYFLRRHHTAAGFAEIVARDDAGVAHTDTDDVGVVIHTLNEAHECDVVCETFSGWYDLNEVGLKGFDAFEDAIEIFGCGKVVMADDEGDACFAKLLKLAFLQALSRFELKIDEVETRGSSF